MTQRMTWLYVGLHILVLGLLLSLVFFAVLSTDDYAFASQARQYTLYEVMVNMFDGWGGRYVEALAAALWYKGADRFSLNYASGLLLIIVLLFAGLYAFLYQIFAGVLRWSGTLVLSLVVLAGLFRGFPTLDESIYWNIGGITYLLPAAFFLFTLGLVLYAHKRRWFIWVQLLSCMLIILADGINEAFVVMNLLLMLGVAGYMLAQRRFQYGVVLPLLTAVFGLLLVFLSKGNVNRMSLYPESGQFLYSLCWAALKGSQAVLQAAVDPYIWGSILLFIPLFLQVRERLPEAYSIKRILPVYLAAFGLMLYGIVAIHYYATGNPPVQRLMVVWYILFVTGVIPLACLLAPLLSRLYNGVEARLFRVNQERPVLRRILLVVVLLAFVLINNPPKAVYDLIYTIPGFRLEVAEFEARVQELQHAQQRPKELVLERFKHRPILLKAPTDADYGIGSYYGFDSVKIVDKPE